MKFDAQATCDKIVEFIREYYKKNNLKGAVIGISGGKDSGVVAGLMTKAIGAQNIVGLTLPCHSQSEDRSLAEKVSEFYGFKLYNCDLTKAFDEFESSVQDGYGVVDKPHLLNSSINLKPRLRMSALYYYAAMMSSIKGGTYLVIGTSNKCELYVGYFTKGGDNVHDISTIADFTVEEVIKIGEYLKVPEKVLYKTPNDGLSNQTDEDKLGVTYKDIAKYMNNEELEEEIRKKIERLHNNNKHKFNIPTYRRED